MLALMLQHLDDILRMYFSSQYFFFLYMFLANVLWNVGTMSM